VVPEVEAGDPSTETSKATFASWTKSVGTLQLAEVSLITVASVRTVPNLQVMADE